MTRGIVVSAFQGLKNAVSLRDGAIALELGSRKETFALLVHS